MTADIRERNVAAGYGQGRATHDEVSEPKAHGRLLAKDALENPLDCLAIQKGLVDVKTISGRADM